MFHRSAICLRKVRITIPQLSPTHTKAKIVRWCLPQLQQEQQTSLPSNNIEVQDYDPLMVLECSADLITKGYREYDNHQPLMIIEVQEEGILKIDASKIQLNQWYDVGTPIGEIDDGDDDDHDDYDEDNDFDDDWIWQAYSYSSEEDEK